MNSSTQRHSSLNQQDIVYRVPGTRWEEALPLGDGCFGAMMYQEGDAFAFTVNHLDVYMAFNSADIAPPKIDVAELTRQATAAKATLDPHDTQAYTRIVSPYFYDTYGWLRRGVWMNIAGQLLLHPVRSPEECKKFEQRLDLGHAAIGTRCAWEHDELRIDAFVSRDQHTLVVELESAGGATIAELVERLSLRRVPGGSNTTSRSGANGADAWLAATLNPGAAVPLDYVIRMRILDETGKELAHGRGVRRDATSVDLKLGGKARRLTILLTVVATNSGQDPIDSARTNLDAVTTAGPAAVKRAHRARWSAFWKKSSIELPDKFLERLWYVNLYALACSDGTGMKQKSQATGLNGLWDIKSPCGWGSSWYWDVNIEEAYWGCYTANHLEMAQPFYDGLREYVPAARRWAKELYGIDAIAPDFPFTFYHCIWPWCCQFLWWGYRYSMDEEFLREVSYPIMRDVLAFFEQFLQLDEDGRYSAFPSVSPEQGPLGPNPTILLATLRYLLSASVQASRVLKIDVARRKKWQELLDNLADFATGESAQFGATFKDSQWAAPTLYLAHPSPLMPIYPTGLINVDSPPRQQELARNTLRYAETLQNLGTFNAGWLSAAASQLGLGDEAHRLIYEKGLAILLRPNGLLAEETDRYIHNCHVLSDPIYLPPMSECSGGVLGAVNEMLLQSRDGKVRVFPALPTAWTEARFDKLLAEGAFEISAEYANGRTAWVEVTARHAGTCHLVVDGRSVKLTLRAGETHREVSVGKGNKNQAVKGDGTTPARAIEIPCYTTPTKRRVFLGKDARSEYLRRLDDFLYDYNLGDTRVARPTKYKFDFGPARHAVKDYASVIAQQLFNGNKVGPDFYHIDPDTAYTQLLRYGWTAAAGKDGKREAVDRKRPDALCRDFVSGSKSASFAVDLMRGQYQLLLVMGDAVAPTHMGVEVRDQFRWRMARPLPAGQFAVEVFPVRVVEDGPLQIRLSGIGSQPWKLNILMVNKVP